MNNTLKQYYSNKFASRNTLKFIQNVEDEISMYTELYDELDENDDAGYTSINNIIENIENHSFHRGINYKLLKSYVNANNVDEVFFMEPIKKANLEGIKKQLWEYCLGYSDAHFEEEIAYEKSMLEAYEQIKTVKALKQWLNDYGIPHYGLKIWKGYLVDSL